MTTTRIYVACLASYNAGKLHGAWIDANQDADAIHDAIKAMLAASPTPGAEEFAIHDSEGFAPWSVGEYEAIETVAEVAALIAEHGEIAAHVMAGEGDAERVREMFDDGYRGEWDSLEQYAEDLLDSTGAFDGCNNFVKRYFDYASFARDLELGGDVTTYEVGGRVHVFDGTI